MDSALKQRLLGAIVLIALAVIFVPMFLGKSPQQQDKTTLNLAIPNPPTTDFQTRTLPVQASTANAESDKVVTVDTHAPAKFDAHPEDSVAKSPSSPTPATAVAKPDAAPAQTAPTAKPPAVAPIVTPAATAPAATVASATTGGRFAVHLGAYADRGHADALVAKLKKLGYPAYDEAGEYQGKSVQRVRVGPFDSRATAETARLKIKRSEPRVPSSVIETAAEQTADAPPAALPTGRAGGWAVQLGAFSTQADANKLSDRLRVAGIAGFVDTTGDGAQKLWRVRAGPYADRSGADKARNTIKQKFSIKNPIVVTVP
ncbi:MAG: SPOR domain-containing protein [Rudaea sp.]